MANRSPSASRQGIDRGDQRGGGFRIAIISALFARLFGTALGKRRAILRQNRSNVWQTWMRLWSYEPTCGAPSR